MNKNILRLAITLSFTCLICGCAILATDHFSKGEGPPPPKGYLLTGSGWSGNLYGYALNNAAQVEGEALITAVQVDNHYQRVWLVGPFLPVIPLFGLEKSGYDGRTSATEPGVKVNVALYLKEGGRAAIDPCRITLGSKTRELSPSDFRTSFQASSRTLACGEGAAPSEVVIPGRADDIYLIELFYRDALYPDNGASVSMPAIEVNGKVHPGTTFRFTGETDTFMQVVL